MSLRRNTVANYVGQGWAIVMNVAFIPLYIEYLGMEAYGLVGVFAMLQSWLSLLDLGLTPAIGREMARHTAGAHDDREIRDLLRSVEVVAFVVATALSIVLWAASHLVATRWLQVENLPLGVVANALAMMGVVAGMRFIENMYRSGLAGLQRQVTLNVILVVSATLRGLGAVLILRFVSPTIWAFFVWQGLVSVITLIWLRLAVYRGLGPSPHAGRPSLSALGGIWRFAAGTVAITALGFVLSQSDKVILSKLLSLETFAVYSLAYTIASGVRLLSQPVDLAVFPRLAQLHQTGDTASLAALYHKSTQANAVLLGSAGVFLAMFGRRVLEIWTGQPDLAAVAYPVIVILTLGMVLNAIMNGPYYLQMAAGWTDLLVKTNVVMVIVFVPLIFLLTREYHMMGAAVAWVLLNLTYLVTVARLMHRRLLPGEMGSWYLRDLALPVGAALGVGLAARQLLPYRSNPVEAIALLVLALSAIVTAAALSARAIRVDIDRYVRVLVERRA
jgi:O-antigen/teichoic acid export membrane protein